MKKTYIVIMSCFFFLWCGLAPLWAAESDTMRLINLLKAKKIITQEEADALLKEMEAEAPKKNAQMKEEIRKEVKTVADKGELLPPALRGFKFGTTIYGEWNNQKADNQASTNKFVLNRAYLTLTKDVNDWLSMNITTDIFNSVDPADNRDGWQLRLKYGYANLNLLGTATQIGLIPTPSDAYDSAIWPFRVQGNNLLDGQSIQSTADFGIANQGVFGGYMDDEYLKFAVKPYAGKWGGYHVGVFNGAGYTNTEANNNKAPSALVYVRPLPYTPILKGLQFAYFGTYGQSNNNFAAGSGVTTDYPDWRVNVVEASLQHEYFTVMGQYYWGKGTFTSTEDHDRNAYQGAAFMRIPGCEKLRVFGKYYYYDPNIDASNDSYRTYVAGLAYDVAPEFMPFFAFERRDFESAAAGADYDKYQIGFQLKF